MPGELALSPRNMITLEGTGTDFDQTYYIDVIERRMQHESWTDGANYSEEHLAAYARPIAPSDTVSHTA